MPIYRYHFFDSGDHFVTTKIVDCETDAEAQETGDSLLASCGYSGVEIWDCGRQVYRVRKIDTSMIAAE